MNMGTASGVEESGHWAKDCRASSFYPRLFGQQKSTAFASTSTATNASGTDSKELDHLEGYNKFADVLQVLNSFEIDENTGQNKNVKGNLKEHLEFWEIRCFIFYIKRNQIRLSFAFLGRTTCILF